MKKVLYILVLIAASACNKELKENPEGQLIGDDALGTIEGLQTALTGVYQPLKNGYSSGFGTANLNATIMGSDDITTHPASNKQELREMDQFAANSTNTRISAIWLGCYKAIQNANNVIDNYEKVSGEVATLNQIGGEAYFLRAFSYFWLVRLWGNIPLITTSKYNTDLLAVTKSTPAAVYALIESDLKKAETLMKDIKPAPGRASAGTAKSLLAEVYLTEGGYPMKDASKYALAAAKAKEVIDNKTKYGFNLVPDLATLWTGTSASNNTPEDVFTLQFCNSCGNPSTLYGKSCMPGDESGWDDYFAEITFFNNFPEGKRKDITFYTVFKTANGDVNWQNGQTQHPYYNKFRVNTPTPGFLTSGTDLSVKLLRYAQVLLTYAEAEARSSGTPSADAYNAVNLIRRRAGLNDLQPDLSGQAFADSIVNERAWELAGEYTRWFDLQRLELVESANSHKAADDLKPIGTITKEKYWLPIPYNETQLNPNL
ncbi:RagB/SusD family nutrient uptake outer membrane protein [Chitinophaga sp. MM2321]|uniref:RagB/SusD family nutrient uptake outer membrane protein n=1 Tax=Chitinophaga sp. MM2321 TaxID=3137178 RepID=UPI0032D5AA89